MITKILILRGSRYLRELLRNEPHIDLLIILGPLSKDLLINYDLYEEFFKKFHEKILVIPSSYDDYTIYNLLKRKYYIEICWTKKLARSLADETYIKISREQYHDQISTYEDEEHDFIELRFIERSMATDERFWEKKIFDPHKIFRKMIVFHGVTEPAGIYIDDIIRISLSTEHEVLIEIMSEEIVLKIFREDIERKIIVKKETGFIS